MLQGVPVSIITAMDFIDSEIEYICELDEHEHDDECYAQVLICTLQETAPIITALDTEATTSIPVTTVPETTSVTTIEEPVASAPDTMVMPEEADTDVIIAEANTRDAGHRHGSSCYTYIRVCRKVSHKHTSDCYPYESGMNKYMCKQIEHIHSDMVCNSYILNCNDTHEHTVYCYAEVCICRLDEHTHDDSLCLPQEISEIKPDKYVCELMIHRHGNQCYGYAPTCGFERYAEHKHTRGCYSYTLTCIIGEHEHTEECFTKSQHYNSDNQNSYEDLKRIDLSDLGNFINSAAIYKVVNGNERFEINPSHEELSADDTYIFTISFNEDPDVSSRQFVYDEYGYLTYIFPRKITVVNYPACGIIYDSIQQEVRIGTYTIEKNQENHTVMRVRFDSVNESGESTDENFVDNYRNTYFYAEVTGQFSSSEYDQIIEFGITTSDDPITIIVSIPTTEETEPQEVELEKIEFEEAKLEEIEFEEAELEEIESEEYVCELIEHEHNDKCIGYYLNCPLEGYPNHDHTDACYEFGLICKIDEHIHSEECLSKKQAFNMFGNVSNSPIRLLAMNANGESSDLSDFVNTAKIYKMVDGVKVAVGPNETLYTNQDYIFSINFREVSSSTPGLTKQFMYDEGFLTYILPDSIYVADALLGEGGKTTIYAPDGTTKLGSYIIEKTEGHNEIKVHFDDVDVKGESTSGINFIDHYRNVYFYIDVQGRFSDTGKNQPIDFGNNVIITVKVEDPPSSLEIKKTGSDYNRVSKTIDYTIAVTSKEGNSSNIIVYDHLKFLSPYDKTTIDYTALTNVKYKLPNGNWTPVTDISSLWQIDKLVFNFPSLAKDETIEIKYTYQLDSFFTTNGIDSSNFDAITLTNTASVENPNGDNPKDTVTTIIGNKMMWKDGSASSVKNADGTTTTHITWNAYVGDGTTLLNNKVITDTLIGTNQTFVDRGTLLENLKVYVYPQKLPDDTETTWKAKRLPLNSFVISVTSNSFTFTVPDGYSTFADGTTEIYRVEFENFKSKVIGNAGAYQNKISMMPTYETSKTVTVSTGIGIKKTSVMTNDMITYTITAEIPGGYQGLPINIQDTLSFYLNGHTEWFCGSVNLTSNFLNENTIVSVYNPDYSNKVIPNCRWINEDGLRLVFGENATTISGSSWPYNDPRLITITYSIPLSTQQNVQGNIGTLEEILQLDKDNNDKYDYLIGNYAYVKNGTTWLAQTNAYDMWPIVKTVKAGVPDDQGNVIFKYTVTVNEQKKKDVFRELDAIFIDTFDSRLEYVPGTFEVEVDWTGYIGNYSLMTPGSFATSIPLSPKTTENTTQKSRTLEISLADLCSKDVSSQMYWAQDLNKPFWFINGNSLSEMGWGPKYTFTYQLMLPAETASTITEPVKFTNNAGIIASGNSLKGTYTDNCEVTYTPKAVVEKTMTQDKNGETGTNTASITIDINPDRKKLASSAPEGTPIKVVDTMSSTLAFNLYSIEIYKNGNEKQSITFSTTSTNENWCYYFSGENELTFNIPDTTYVTIKYTALIKGVVGSSVDVWNEVSVAGNYEDRIEKTFNVSDTYGGAGASKEKVKLIKKDGITGEGLAGAEFKLYVVTNENDSGIDKNDFVTIDDYTFYLINNATWTTDSDGTAELSSSYIFAGSDHIFLLYESKVPTDYPTPPNPKTLFTFDAKHADSNIKLITDNITIYNTKQTTEVKLYKYNEDGYNPDVETGTILEDAKFGVYKCSSNNSTETADQVRSRNIDIISYMTYDDTNKFYTSQLPAGTYKIVETTAPRNYALSPYVFKVVITNDLVVTITEETGSGGDGWWIDADNNTIRVKNEKWHAVIEGLKKVTGNFYGDTYPTFSFLLQPIDDIGGNVLMSDDEQIIESVTVPGKFQFTLTGLSWGVQYFYELTEIIESNEGWTYDTTVYHVQIDVHVDGTYTVTYYRKNSNTGEFEKIADNNISLLSLGLSAPDSEPPVTFTNKYTLGTTTIFPQTGNIGSNTLTTIGIGLMLVSMLLTAIIPQTIQGRKRPNTRKLNYVVPKKNIKAP